MFFLSFSIVGDKGDTGATGASGTPFTLTLNESGSSLANWTQAVGTWTVVSSEFEVTTPATTVDRLRLTSPIAQSAIVYEGQFKMFSGTGHGADNRMGLEFNMSGTSTVGCLVTLRGTGALNPSSTGTIYTEEPGGVTAGPTFTFHFNLDQFYTIRAVAIGNVMDIYIDGTYQCTHARQPISGATEHGFIGVYAYNCKIHAKNIKMYAVTLP